MGYLREFEKAAIDSVYHSACGTDTDKRMLVVQLCEGINIDVECLIPNVLKKPVTINFHPDRLSNNRKMIIENLLEDGKYLGKFQTGTTNGGKTAFIGGDRFLWEQRLFSSAYPADTKHRPKYGALNLLSYLDGASTRFGSCFFTLRESALNQCTFAYGDSSTNPETLCTRQAFWGILAALLTDVVDNGRFLNIENCSLNRATKLLLSNEQTLQVIGCNLDYCVETHIHGDILLGEDIDALYLDESFNNTEICHISNALSKKYNIKLYWIPKRQIHIDSIDDNFRGPMMKPLAKKIDNWFGNGEGVINAALIGKASRDSIIQPSKWSDIGNEHELFQYFKQLWHTTAFYGYPAHQVND